VRTFVSIHSDTGSGISGVIVVVNNIWIIHILDWKRVGKWIHGKQ